LFVSELVDRAVVDGAVFFVGFGRLGVWYGRFVVGFSRFEAGSPFNLKTG
jgi:hypothetical protein